MGTLITTHAVCVFIFLLSGKVSIWTMPRKTGPPLTVNWSEVQNIVKRQIWEPIGIWISLKSDPTYKLLKYIIVFIFYLPSVTRKELNYKTWRTKVHVVFKGVYGPYCPSKKYFKILFWEDKVTDDKILWYFGSYTFCPDT